LLEYFFVRFILDPAVERARVGRDGMLWQGATTLRAGARKEEQRRQSAPARLNRVCSALLQPVNAIVCSILNIHAGLPVEESGQLPDLGSMRRRDMWCLCFGSSLCVALRRVVGSTAE
jgi:hypothetical protein